VWIFLAWGLPWSPFLASHTGDLALLEGLD